MTHYTEQDMRGELRQRFIDEHQGDEDYYKRNAYAINWVIKVILYSQKPEQAQTAVGLPEPDYMMLGVPLWRERSVRQALTQSYATEAVGELMEGLQHCLQYDDCFNIRLVENLLTKYAPKKKEQGNGKEN